MKGLEIIQTEGKNTGKDGPANKAVIDALIEAGALLARGQLKHSYPHSWRSKAPLIFRNTPQWFIALDKPYAAGNGRTLRQVALDEIERVDWGQRRVSDESDQNRIKGMIEDRPDWLISRQRNWGVPLPIFVRKSDGAILQDEAVDARMLDAMHKRGADVWWATPRARIPGQRSQRRGLREGRRHSRCLVRFRLDARLRSGRTQCADARLVQKSGFRALSRRLGPASRLVSILAAGKLRHARARAL